MRTLGISGPGPEQIAIDYMASDLSLAMKALLGFALKLTLSPSRVSRADFDALRTYWYTDQQITEAVVIVGLAKFANYVSFALGTVPDFDSSKIAAINSEAPQPTVLFVSNRILTDTCVLSQACMILLNLAGSSHASHPSIGNSRRTRGQALPPARPENQRR